MSGLLTLLAGWMMAMAVLPNRRFYPPDTRRLDTSLQIFDFYFEQHSLVPPTLSIPELEQNARVDVGQIEVMMTFCVYEAELSHTESVSTQFHPPV